MPAGTHPALITAMPARPADRQEFEQAVVILTGPKAPAPHAPYLPVVVRVWKPYGDGEKWVLSNPEVNPKGVDARSFAPRDLPGFTRQPPLWGREGMMPAPGRP